MQQKSMDTPRYYSKKCLFKISFNLFNSPVFQELLLSSLLCMKVVVSKKISHVAMITQQITGRCHPRESDSVGGGGGMSTTITAVLHDLGGALWHKWPFAVQEWKALGEALLWYPVTLRNPGYVYKICHTSLAGYPGYKSRNYIMVRYIKPIL